MPRVLVRVHPRASRKRLTWDGTRLELWIHEPPVDGTANAAVVREVSKWLGVSRSRVRIVSGVSSREKLLDVDVGVALPAPLTAT